MKSEIKLSNFSLLVLGVSSINKKQTTVQASEGVGSLSVTDVTTTLANSQYIHILLFGKAISKFDVET